MKDWRKAAGFSLIELVAVVLIAAILMSIAVPSYRYVTTSNRMSSELNSLVGDLQYARNEAIKEGQYVTVCVSTDSATCSTSPSASWASGWITFSDVSNTQTVTTPPDVLLRANTLFAINNSTDTFTSTVTSVTFNREGFASALTASPTTFTLHNTPTVNTFTRCLQLSSTGYLTTVLYGATGCS